MVDMGYVAPNLGASAKPQLARKYRCQVFSSETLDTGPGGEYSIDMKSSKRIYCLRINGTIKEGLEEKHLGRCDGGHVEYKQTAKPSYSTLEKWLDDGVANSIDGCRVEPDGTCPHELPSWLMRLGYI